MMMKYLEATPISHGEVALDIFKAREIRFYFLSPKTQSTCALKNHKSYMAVPEVWQFSEQDLICTFILKLIQI